jgi:hypothetical protein
MILFSRLYLSKFSWVSQEKEIGAAMYYSPRVEQFDPNHQSVGDDDRYP